MSWARVVASALAGTATACALPEASLIDQEPTEEALGSGGSSSASGTPGGAGGMGGVAGPCDGRPGPAMVPVPAVDGSTYCIDATEVTQEHYAEFLGHLGASVPAQPQFCSWNTDLEPINGVTAANLSQPVTTIDWCDAAAYCAWAGKRLCGSIAGGPGAFGDVDAKTDEWLNACTAQGARDLPYDSAFDPAICNGQGAGVGEMWPVASSPACQGGYPGIFDIVGNAGEMRDGCNGYGGRDDLCGVWGGSFDDGNAFTVCSAYAPAPRDGFYGNVGFRCCADAAP